MRFFPSPRPQRAAPSTAVVACVFGQTSRRFLSGANRRLRVIESISYLRRRTWRLGTHRRPESNLSNLEGAQAPRGIPARGTAYYGNKYREELLVRREKRLLRTSRARLPTDRGRFTRHSWIQFAVVFRRSSSGTVNIAMTMTIDASILQRW